MSDPANFVFVDDVAQFDDSGAAMVARIAAGVRGKRELLALLARQLEFPGYFGHNWDALFDCLCELTGPVMIIHAALPLRTAAQRRSYLEVLRDAAPVRAVFPAACREQVIAILAELVDFSGESTKLENLPAESQRRLDVLMEKNNRGQLGKREQSELAQLVRRTQEITLHNARVLVEQQRRLKSE